jgi:hypothetical protein
VTAHFGSVQVTATADGPAAALSGTGTLVVGATDVAAAADELSVTRQPDVEKPVGQTAVRWTKQELVLASLFLVTVAYWLLSPTEQQHLVKETGRNRGRSHAGSSNPSRGQCAPACSRHPG